MLTMTKLQLSDGRLTKYDNSETMIRSKYCVFMGNGKSMFAAYSQGYMPTGSSGPDLKSLITMKLDIDQDLQTAYMEIIGIPC